MPISSTHLSRVNDHLAAAIRHLKEAEAVAVSHRADRHALALRESRVTGLIDAVQWQTRISEALLTVEGIRDAPCLGASIGELVFPSRGRRDDTVDEQSTRSCSLDEPGGSGSKVEDGSFFVRDTMQRIAKGEPWQGQHVLRGGAFTVSDGFAYPLDPTNVQVTDQNPPDGMEA